MNVRLPKNLKQNAAGDASAGTGKARRFLCAAKSLVLRCCRREPASRPNTVLRVLAALLLGAVFSSASCLFPGGFLCRTAYAASGTAQQDGPSATERIGKAREQILKSKVGKYGMTPVRGIDVADGVYEVKVDSSSPFFKIVEAKLHVQDHRMTAEIIISSQSYQWAYPGTAGEADAAPETDYLGYREAGARSIFTLPVEALDMPVECAAYSKKRKRWYDRQLVFYASSLPEEALDITLPDYEAIEAAILAFDPEETPSASSASAAGTRKQLEPVSLTHADGEYSIEVNMTGGSGRASISSPTLLIIRDGKAYARLLWSSAHYDYMILEDTVYYNLSDDGGNSSFEIPITAMDEGIPVIADTTAMGDPIEIHYTLTFYEESIGEKNQIPQEAAKKVLIIAAGIIIVGGILNHYLKEKRK